MQPINSTVNPTRSIVPDDVLGVVVGIAICKRNSSSHPATQDDIRAARNAALDDMNAQAEELCADAVIGIRFDNSLGRVDISARGCRSPESRGGSGARTAFPTLWIPAFAGMTVKKSAAMAR